jgi:cobalt-zinc-cadmium efflux system outer membrane protein
MKKISTIYLTVFLLVISVKAFSQQEKNIPLTLSQYLENVSKGNLGYIAGQFNVSIAEANLRAAHAFADPEVSAGYSNNEDQTLMMGQSIETGISYPVNLGNKRKAGINLAHSKMELEQSVLGSYLQNLKADASLSYYSALKQLYIYRLQQDSYERSKELARADSIRLKAGEIMELDAMQSSLDARAQLNQVLQYESEMHNALVNLLRMQGKTLNDTIFVPSEDFPLAKQNFSLAELIQRALQNRADLQAAVMNHEVSEKNLRLIKANRSPEINLEAGYSHSMIVRNDIAPAPAFNSYNAGISIPLKFSNINRGEVRSAKYEIAQSETIRKDVENQIVNEVTIAYNNFVAKEKQMENFRHDLVENAGKILTGRTYLYQRGECSLLDVLNARKTYNELKKEYYETLYEYTSALIELKRSEAID